MGTQFRRATEGNALNSEDFGRFRLSAGRECEKARFRVGRILGICPSLPRIGKYRRSAAALWSARHLAACRIRTKPSLFLNFDQVPTLPSDEELTSAGREHRPDLDTHSIQAATGQPVNLSIDGNEEDSREARLAASSRKRFLLSALPSWLISLMVHLALILILAAISFEPVKHAVSILQASMFNEQQPIEQFDLQGPVLDTKELLEDPLETQSPTISEAVPVPELSPATVRSMETSIESLETNRITERIIPSELLGADSLAQMSAALSGRSAASKSEMLERYGGTAASEKAVAMGLKWIAAHQARDGGWTFAHSAICNNQCKDQGDMDVARNGATAMALLPFLGAGQTHVEGQYKETVYRGLEFLINRLQVTPSRSLPLGSWHETGGRMYSHALASITVCEAYAMTRDPDLFQPAQLSLNYLIQAQSPRDGGWRYNPGEPGDTSVVGWCLMALKSGKMGNLAVPQTTFQAADKFLDYVSTNNGAYYGYNKPTSKLEGRQATIAVGLLCRMYLGYPKEHPGLQEGIQYLGKLGPQMSDLYYSYYATQVMRHHGGDIWDRWNNRMREGLIQAQVKNGHAAGSWFQPGSHTRQGGRLYTTSLATMILEVYYRHMPLYSERSSSDDFEI